MLNRSLGIGYLVHPIPLAAVALLALNDHFLKVNYPSYLTGKLSDLAGVFVFPILLCALWNLSLNLVSAARSLKHFQWITLRQATVAIAVTDMIFVGVKIGPAIRDVYVRAMGVIGFPSHVTPDVTDLIALGMNVFTWLYVCKQVRAGPARDS